MRANITVLSARSACRRYILKRNEYDVFEVKFILKWVTKSSHKTFSKSRISISVLWGGRVLGEKKTKAHCTTSPNGEKTSYLTSSRQGYFLMCKNRSNMNEGIIQRQRKPRRSELATRLDVAPQPAWTAPNDWLLL